jgi:hypothetical protein
MNLTMNASKKKGKQNTKKRYIYKNFIFMKKLNNFCFNLVIPFGERYLKDMG